MSRVSSVVHRLVVYVYLVNVDLILSMQSCNFFIACRYWESSWNYGNESISAAEVQSRGAQAGRYVVWPVGTIFSVDLIY